MTDVVIVGGGVIGLTAAWELSRNGHQVTVLDQSAVGTEASWAGAGMIPPGDPLHPTVHLLARTSAELWPRLSAELREATGIDNGYRRCGGWLFSEGAGDSLPEIVRRWNSLGITAQVIDRSILAEMEPACSSQLPGAVLLPGLAQVRNPRHLKALQAACSDAGVMFHPHCGVTGWEIYSDRVTAAISKSDRFPAGQFVVAAGAWTEKLLGTFRPQLRIEPVRGQILLLNAGRPLFRRVIEVGSRYLVPRDDGRILVGSTEEHMGFQKENTAEAISSLRELAIGMVPELAQIPLERTWAGLRPWSARGRPWIGPVPGFSNLLVAAGHFRAGLSNSPATARLIRELVEGVSTEIDATAFAVTGEPA